MGWRDCDRDEREGEAFFYDCCCYSDDDDVDVNSEGNNDSVNECKRVIS